MTQYVVHKIGFFYTDECFSAFTQGAYDTEEAYKGSVHTIHKTLDAAKKAKRISDIESMKKQGGQSATDFFFDVEDYDAVFTKIEAFYTAEGWTIEDKYYFGLPSPMTDTDAEFLLEVMGLTFHEIVEYEDAFKIEKKNYGKMPDCDEF